MRILSLCTGYAGLDLAVEAVTGARTVAVADIDPGACKILAHRFPHAPNLGDLKLIDWDAWAGTEVMTAGYPCQPFSHAGKRAGTNDPRHIFPYIAEGIRRVGPRLVVLENVRGHLALGFDVVLGALADIGYDARWVCVRASDVGAPHKRERMFIVATPHDAGRVGGYEAVELDGHGTAQANRAGVPDESDRRPDWARPSRGAVEDTHGAVGRQWRLTAPGQAESRGTRADAGRRGGAPDWGPYGPAIARWAEVTGSPAPNPHDERGRLSARFVEWMMGLPAGWVTDVPGLSRNAQLHALGNGVVPRQAATALAHLLERDAS